MGKPNVLVVRAAGSNCDEEMAHAFRLAGGGVNLLHINRLLESPKPLEQAQILAIPGGFTYGDDISAGKVFGNQLRFYLREAVFSLIHRGGLVLGVCNGFQILVKAGLLPDPKPLQHGETGGGEVTLGPNRSGKFEDRWIRLKTERSKSVFAQDLGEMELPVAHAEGRFAVSDPSVLKALEENGQIVFRYAASGSDPIPCGYPDNPNGSVGDVAGICDPTGRILGLMPHPERYVHGTQHPRWTRMDRPKPEGDGLAVFRNAVRHFSD